LTDTKLSRYSSLIFLAICFGFSWLLFLPNVLADSALTTTGLLAARILASFGPALAAIAAVWVREGKSSVTRLFKSAVDFSGKGRWILAAVLIAVLAILVPLVFLVYTRGLSLAPITASSWLRLLPDFILSLLLFGSIADEIGWRGYLLPSLQQSCTAFSASLIIGLLWGLWQMPTYFFQGVIEFHLSPVWLIIETIALSIILTWLYNSSKSLAVTIVFNGVFRTLTQFFMPLMEVTNNAVQFQQLYSGVLVNAALIILLFCGGKTLVFSYQPRRSGDRR